MSWVEMPASRLGAHRGAPSGVFSAARTAPFTPENDAGHLVIQRNLNRIPPRRRERLESGHPSDRRASLSSIRAGEHHPLQHHSARRTTTDKRRHRRRQQLQLQGKPQPRLGHLREYRLALPGRRHRERGARNERADLEQTTFTTRSRTWRRHHVDGPALHLPERVRRKQDHAPGPFRRHDDQDRDELRQHQRRAP